MVMVKSVPNQWGLMLGSSAFSGLVAGYHLHDHEPLRRFDTKYQERLIARRGGRRSERRLPEFDDLLEAFVPDQVTLGIILS